MIINIIALFLLLLFLVQGLLAIVFFFIRRKNKKVINSLSNNTYLPKVSVILPFRGLDCNFEDTIKSLLNQNYDGDYEVFFVSSEEKSVAISLVKKYTEGVANAHFINAAKTNTSKFRSDKVNNLLCGVNAASNDSDVYIFIDSDILPHKNWLKQMVTPLQKSDCGVTSASAWIVSEKKDTIYTLAARYWDFLATTMITFPFTKFARGFSFAMRKETFEMIGMKKVWENAFHDNFTLSSAIRKHKMKIMYIPDCLVSENFSIRGFEWVKWVKRQALNTKVNFKKLWSFGFFFVTLPRLIGFIGFFVSLLLRLALGMSNPIINTFLAWPIIFAITSLLVIFAVYPDRKCYDDYNGSFFEKIKLLFSAYFSVVYCFSSIWAVISNTMEWRALTYHEKTPYTTSVKER